MTLKQIRKFLQRPNTYVSVRLVLGENVQTVVEIDKETFIQGLYNITNDDKFIFENVQRRTRYLFVEGYYND